MSLNCWFDIDTDLTIDELLAALATLPDMVLLTHGTMDPCLAIDGRDCDDEDVEIAARDYGFRSTRQLSLAVRKTGCEDLDQHLVRVWAAVLALPVRAAGVTYDDRRLLVYKNRTLTLEGRDPFWTPELRALLGGEHQMAAIHTGERVAR